VVSRRGALGRHRPREAGLRLTTAVERSTMTHCEVRVEVAACFESRDEGAACSGARIMNNKQLWH
jgi:hypothetical protein